MNLRMSGFILKSKPGIHASISCFHYTRSYYRAYVRLLSTGPSGMQLQMLCDSGSDTVFVGVHACGVWYVATNNVLKNLIYHYGMVSNTD